MKKVSFAMRWGIVFVVLGAFTLFSVTAMSMGSSGKAYADAISHSKDKDFRHSKHYVVFDDEDGDRGHGQQGKRAKIICAINQDQLDSLRTQFPTTVYTTTDVDGDQKGIAEVDKTAGTNKHDIYEAIGLDKQGPKCQLIKTPHSFLLFLVPGVS